MLTTSYNSFKKLPISFSDKSSLKESNVFKSTFKSLASAGNNVIRMLPPFIIEEKHVDEMIEILSAVIEEVNG